MKKTALALTVAAFASSASAEQAIYAVAMPEGSFLSRVDLTFMELAGEAGSTVEFQPFFSGGLGNFNETFDLVAQGGANMGAVVSGYHPSQLPLFSSTNAIPAVFADGRDAVETTQRLVADITEVQAELETQNLVPVLYRPLPAYRIMCTEPVETLADLEGRKVRTFGAYVPRLFQALGAIPVDVSLPEFYEALERGTVDCGYFTYALFEQFNIHEVAPYISDLSFGAINGYTIFANADWWNGLSDADREALSTAARDAEEFGFELIAGEEDRALAAMIEAGATLVPFSDTEAFEAALPDMVTMWLEATGEEIPGASEVASQLASAGE